MYEVKFNETSNSDYDLYASRPEKMPATKWKRTSYSVSGMDGNIYETEDTVEDIEINIKFGFVCEQDKWGEAFRKAKGWLLSKKGNSTLELSDDDKFFYKVKAVEIDDAERKVKTIGEFNATFICEGWMYDKEGAVTYGAIGGGTGLIFENPYGYESHPIYEIAFTGEWVEIVLGYSGKMELRNESEHAGVRLIVDTERMQVYTENGENVTRWSRGDFEDLYFEAGKAVNVDVYDNTTTKVTELLVTPRWRCL